MEPIDRRKFLKSTALAGTGLFFMPHIQGSFLSLSPISEGYFLREFGITDALCQRLLAKALSRGGDFADLYFEHSVSNYLGLEDGKVNQSYGNISLGVGIRTVVGDQIGYGFTQDLSESAMMSAATTASTLSNQAAASVKGSFTRLNFSNNFPVDAGLIEIPIQSKLPLIQRVNEQCLSQSALISKVNAGFSHSVKHIMVVTSDGVIAEDTIPGGFMYASVVAKKDGRTEQSFWNIGGRRDLSFYTQNRIDDMATKAVTRAVRLFDAKQPPAGEMPVVLGPGVTGVLLHEAIGHGMEADFNRKNVSTYSSMLGKKVAEPFVTIVDDATNLNLNGSVNFDDEGVPGQRTVLVENGILKGYLHDKISARHYKIEPTGNGRRESFEHYPMPRMRNTYMLGGEATPDEVIKQAKNGIYVEDVSNGQVKIGEGDFAFYVSQGWLIEDGKLTTPIKDVNIMGNGPKMLSNITMVANNLQLHEGGAGYCGKNGQSMPVSFGLPTCLVKSLTVGGTQLKGGA